MKVDMQNMKHLSTLNKHSIVPTLFIHTELGLLKKEAHFYSIQSNSPAIPVD